MQAWWVLAGILRLAGRFDEALECCDRGLALDPDNPDLHYARGLILLVTGRLHEGWSEFAWHDRTTTFNRPDIPLPLWDGSNLGDEALLIHAEQGIGDQIMMMSAIPDLLRITRNVVIECDPRLVPLFARSFPGVLVRADRFHEPGRNDGIGAYLPASAIFQHLRTDIESFSKHQGYLVADQKAVQRWHDRFSRFGSNLKVGISWHGGANARVSSARSIALQRWIPLLSLSGISFINLQYGNSSEIIREMREQHGVVIHDFEETDPISDLDDFAAQISALDLVISIDNSTVHMAGALNVKTWVMLPRLPDWRWLLTGDTSYWYPALRLFRQPKPGDWHTVLQNVTSALNELMNSRAEGSLPS